MADMNYGILASGSCLLTDIVDRLSRHLAKGTPKDALKAYLIQVKKWCPDQPVLHIDSYQTSQVHSAWSSYKW